MTLPAEVEVIAFMAIPLGIGVGVLRYRLWDIDVIIRKTLIYTVLTVLLALVYFGSVVLLQCLFGPLTSVAQSPLAESSRRWPSPHCSRRYVAVSRTD